MAEDIEKRVFVQSSSPKTSCSDIIQYIISVYGDESMSDTWIKILLYYLKTFRVTGKTAENVKRVQ